MFLMTLSSFTATPPIRGGRGVGEDLRPPLELIDITDCGALQLDQAELDHQDAVALARSGRSSLLVGFVRSPALFAGSASSAPAAQLLARKVSASTSSPPKRPIAIGHSRFCDKSLPNSRILATLSVSPKESPMPASAKPVRSLAETRQRAQRIFARLMGERRFAPSRRRKLSASAERSRSSVST